MRALRFGYLDSLNRALDFASSAEDAVLLPGRVRFPNRQQALAAIVSYSLIHPLLFRRNVHSVEDVCGADGYAYAVGYADVEVDPDRPSVNVQFLANSFLPKNLVPKMLFHFGPLVGEAWVID